MKNFWYWFPRILMVVYILFISIFAADAFEQKQWFLALVIHLIPSFILTASTIVAWKNEKLGGGLLFVLGILLAMFFHSFLIMLPVFVAAGIFLRGGISKTK